MARTIFLTGATGLVGSQLLKEFDAQQYRIYAVSRKSKHDTQNVKWIKADISKGCASLYKYIKKSDVIVHNAACVKTGDSIGEQFEIQAVNIEFTKQLLEFAINKNIEKFVFTSSLNIIEKPLPLLITENAKINYTNSYAKSKFIGEQLVQFYAEKQNLNYCIFRLSSPISFDIYSMPQTVVKKWIDQSLKGNKIMVSGKGARTQDFISVADISQAYVKSIQRTEVQGIFNLASGNTISMFELAQIITQKLGSKYEFYEIDENENDRWNISISRANIKLGFSPKYTSRTVIEKLINSIIL